MHNLLIRNTFLFVSAVLSIFLFATCSRTPKGVVSEKKMRYILVDMHLAEAMINTNPQDYRTNEAKKELYQTVFEKYNLTEAQYDSSLIWYGKNLDLYMRIYNLALADVKKQVEAMGDVKPEAVSSNQDSVDIWMYRKYYEFSPHALSNTILFDFKPAQEYASGSAFILGFQVWGLTPQMKTPIELHFRAAQSDTTIMVKKTIHTNGYHELLLETLPTKKVKRVYGYIRLNDRKLSVPYHKIYLDDIRLTRFNYGSAYIEQYNLPGANGLIYSN